MVENPVIVENLIKEHEDLLSKINKLEKFIKSERFNEISMFQSQCLLMQFNYMLSYCNILATRIRDLGGIINA